MPMASTTLAAKHSAQRGSRHLTCWDRMDEGLPAMRDEEIGTEMQDSTEPDNTKTRKASFRAGRNLQIKRLAKGLAGGGRRHEAMIVLPVLHVRPVPAAMLMRFPPSGSSTEPLGYQRWDHQQNGVFHNATLINVDSPCGAKLISSRKGHQRNDYVAYPCGGEVVNSDEPHHVNATARPMRLPPCGSRPC